MARSARSGECSACCRGHGVQRVHPETLDSSGSAPATGRKHGRCRPRHGDELGTARAPLGDDPKKGGENVWISRIAIDLTQGVAQSVVSSETRARRTSSEHRKVGAREARREAARRNGGKPRERCRAESRKGSETREGTVTGVGTRIRLRWSVVRHGDFPGVAGAGPGRGCPTRSRNGASGPSLTWPRGAREASAERLLGVASRPGPGGAFPFRGRRAVLTETVSGLDPARERRGSLASRGTTRAWLGARLPPPGGSARPGPGRDRRDV